MEHIRMKRGAWRRNPVLPRAMTAQGGATVTANPAWTERQPEARRAPDQWVPGVPPLPEPEPDPGPAPQPVPGDQGPEPAQAVRLGGCLCGAVRYEATGAPKLVELCHCADCRKANGGNATHYGTWPAASIRIHGKLAVHAGRGFCPSCGSQVAHVAPHSVTLLLGTMDLPPNDLVPQRETWTIRREPWAAPVPGAAQFERDPD